MLVILLSGMTNTEIATLFAIIFAAPAFGITLTLFTLSKIFKTKEPAHKILKSLTIAGVVATTVILGYCVYILLS
jgi:hypothetical protein